MFDDTPDLTRRKALIALGGVGAGAVLGGGATMAFFSDTETFEDNKLTTGELDLKVDWQEHYSDWSPDEDTAITVSMDPSELNDPVGFPSAAPMDEQSLFTEAQDKELFLENTAIEAFPDTDNDGLQDSFEEAFPEGDICQYPADLDGNSEGVLSDPLRTRAPETGIGEPPNPQQTSAGDPLVHIDDVKPGDFGEVTFSFHLCDNDGFVWLMGQLVDADENGNSEPESNDPDEIGPGETDPENRILFDNEGDESNGTTIQEPVELLDEIKAAIWIDAGSDGDGRGNNFLDSGEEIVRRGSLRELLQELEHSMIPLNPAAGDGTNGGGTDPTTVGPGDGSTLADEVIVTRTDPRFPNTARNLTCADYEAELDVGSIAGSEVLNADDTTIESGTPISGCTTGTVNSAITSTGTLTITTVDAVNIVSVKGGPDGEQVYVFDDPVVLDEVTFSTPGDNEISNVDICCPTNGGPQNGDRQCFTASTTAFVGFEWWLPVDHANEIQTDSVTFDLGFYTEQCRHNNGLDPSLPIDGTDGTDNTGNMPGPD